MLDNLSMDDSQPVVGCRQPVYGSIDNLLWVLLIIFIPIFMPVIRQLGVDPVHFGIIVTINLAIGQITPPIGVNLFVASRIGEVPLNKLSRAVLPLILAEVIALLLVTFIPGLSLWLVN